MTTPSKDTLTTEQRLKLMRDELTDDALEGFAEIERGEVSVMTMDDLKREMSKSHQCKNTPLS